MSDREEFLKKQSVGSVFVEVSTDGLSDRKRYDVLEVVKVLKTKLVCREMKNVGGKFEPKNDILRDCPFVAPRQRGYLRSPSSDFYALDDPELKPIIAEIRETRQKYAAVNFLREIKEEELTPKVLALVAQIREEIQGERNKSVTPTEQDKRPER